MKKLLIVVAIAFIAMQGNAQEFKFGAKAGLNFSDVYGDDVSDSDMRTVFHIGLVAEYQFNDQFAIQPELLYSEQGAKGDGGAVKLSYINLPIIAKYYVAPGFSLQAGPQVSFLTKAKAAGEDVKDYIKNVDFGLNFGVGYKFTENLFIDARYNLGLTKIDDEEGEKVDIKNCVIQLSVGYFF